MNIRKRLKGSLRITFSAMTVALTVMVLYMASVAPWGKLALYFLSSVFITMLVEESEWALAIVAYAVSGFIAFVFVANKLMVAPYIALLGHYGIFRQFVQLRVRDPWLRRFIKLLYINAFAALCILAVGVWLELMDFSALLAILPFWAWAAIAQVVFILYDALFSITVRLYDTMLRPALLGRQK